jgi:hypothetical protein
MYIDEFDASDESPEKRQPIDLYSRRTNVHERALLILVDSVNLISIEIYYPFWKMST